MSFIEVDPEELRMLARRLDAVVEVAREVKHSRDGLKALASGAGDEGVREAFESFLDAWAHGCGCIVEDAEALAQHVAYASRIYVENERAIGRSFGDE